MSVIRVEDEWEHTFTAPCYIEFASASPVGGLVADFQVYFNEELVDRVHINVPHSWWKNAGQQITPANPVEGDVLRFVTDHPTDVRLDIIYP
jgi:hypothetical protein